jgi:hypothetical protein
VLSFEWVCMGYCAHQCSLCLQAVVDRTELDDAADGQCNRTEIRTELIEDIRLWTLEITEQRLPQNRGQTAHSVLHARLVNEMPTKAEQLARKVHRNADVHMSSVDSANPGQEHRRELV